MDTVYTIFTKREMSQDHVDSEMQRWLELLLQLVNITGPNPAQHLGLFLQSKHDVLRKYRHISQKFVSAGYLDIHKAEEDGDPSLFFSPFNLMWLIATPHPPPPPPPPPPPHHPPTPPPAITLGSQAH